jgi:hypothetical protein
MYIDARLPGGHVVVCSGTGADHSFLVRRLGLSIECPICGSIALSGDLIASYYERMMSESGFAVIRREDFAGLRCAPQDSGAAAGLRSLPHRRERDPR